MGREAQAHPLPLRERVVAAGRRGKGCESHRDSAPSLALARLSPSRGHPLPKGGEGRECVARTCPVPIFNFQTAGRSRAGTIGAAARRLLLLERLDNVERERVWPGARRCSCCKSRSIGLRGITATRFRRAADGADVGGGGGEFQNGVNWNALGNPHAGRYCTAHAVCSAACASRRMRPTIERRPFERCGVKFSRRPS
jgi:hypothetical protein